MPGIPVDPEALAALCRRFHVRRLDGFGSAWTGHFDPGRSDVDLLVDLAELPPGDYADAYFGLLSGLETLFGRKIDLLTAPALANPYLRQRIEAERRTLFEAA